MLANMRHIHRADRFYAWFPAMHSRVDVLFVDCRQEADLVAIAHEVQQLTLDLEHLANCYDASSPLALHNADASHPLPDELGRILDLCRMYREQTFGLFDPWYEGRCNLSGFLKGYALDRICPLLQARAIGKAVVSMGNSSIMDYSSPTEPSFQAKEPERIGQGSVLTTSGNDTPQRRHIVHPLTGEYVTGKRTVSVSTPLVCTDADGRNHFGGALGEVLSTAFFLADEEQREQLLQRFPAATLQGPNDQTTKQPNDQS